MSENTQKLYLVNVRADGSPIPFTTVGGAILPSRNTWGESKYTFYFDYNPGTGAAGSFAAQVETADGSGADAGLSWSIVGTSQTATGVLTVNSPLVKIRLNVTAFVASGNANNSLTVAAVCTHD
jgi:hypothetical protein